MGWIILGVIALIIGLLLWFPIRVGVSSGEGGFALWVKLLFYTVRILPKAEKEETPRQAERRKRREARKNQKKLKSEKKKAARKKKEDSSKEEKPPKEKQKKTLQEWLRLIKLFAQSGGRLARRFWKGFRIDHFTLQMAVAGGDAAQTAITYGKINAAVYSAYSVAEQVVTLRKTNIRIVPDFLSEQSRTEISGELFFRVCTLLAALFSGGIFLLKGFLAEKKQKPDKERDTLEQQVVPQKAD